MGRGGERKDGTTAKVIKPYAASVNFSYTEFFFQSSKKHTTELNTLEMLSDLSIQEPL